jgi:hypothetical protein
MSFILWNSLTISCATVLSVFVVSPVTFVGSLCKIEYQILETH